MVAKGFKKKYFSLAAIAATVSAVSLNAQAATVATTENVVVSASKYEESVEETTEDIEIVTFEEIEERGLKSLKEVLEYIKGVSLSSSGGYGKATSVYLRGLNTDKVLILIDGIRYNDPSNTNGASIEHLLLNNIQKIEIIKGPQSGIWGADAASGVINIITKQAIKGTNIDFDIERGSFNSKNIKFLLSQKAKNFFYQINYNYFSTDGVSAITPYNENPKDYERDGYINRNLSLKGGYNFDNGFFEIGANYINADNEADQFGDPNSKNDDTFQYDSYFLNGSFFVNSHDFVLHLDKTETKREFLDTTWGVKNFEGKTKRFEIKDRFYLKDIKLIAGLEYQKFSTDYLEVFGDSGDISYSSKSFFLSGKKRFDDLLVSMAMRYDNYSSFDDQTTAKFGLKYYIKDLIFFTNIANAYNVPNQVKILNPWGASNFDLQPEKTRSFDGGFEYQGLKILVFYQKVKDLIDWFDPDDIWWNNNSYYKNFEGSSKFKGIEIGYKKDILENLLIELGYTYLNAKDPNNDDLPRRAKNRYTYSLTWYPTQKHTININGYYIGKKFDDKEKSKQIGKYNVTNVLLSHNFAKNFTGYINIKNIFNKRYQEVYGYGSYPRGIYIGLRGSF